MATLDTVSENNKASVLRKIGGQYYRQEDYKKSIIYNNKALKIDKVNYNKEGIIKDIFNISLSYSDQNNPKKALSLLFEAMKLIDQINNDKIKQALLFNIGDNFLDLKDNKKGKKYALKALELAKKIKNEGRIAISLNLLGCSVSQDSDEAMNYYLESLEIYKKNRDTAWVNIVTINMGTVFKHRGDYIKAMEYYNKSFSLIKSDNLRWTSSLLINLGSCQSKIGMLDESIKNCEKALDIATEHQLIDLQTTACGCLSESYKKKGMLNESFKYYEQHIATKDSIRNNKILMETTGMEMQFEFKKQELKWELEQEKDKMAIKQREKWVLFLSIISLVVILLSIIIYIQKKRTLKSNEKLVDRNLELMKSEKQLQLIKSNSKNTQQKLPNSKPEKYFGSSLTKEQSIGLMNDIIQLMEKEKTFTKHEITLGLLSDILVSYF